MAKKLTSFLLSCVLLFSIMILPAGAELVVTPGEVGRIDVILVSPAYQYTAEDFPGVDIEKIEQDGKYLYIYIPEKTEEATDAAMEQIKVILDGKYKSIIQNYNVIGVVKTGHGLAIGDVNGRGGVNLADASLLMQYIAGWDVEIYGWAADMNGDKSINLADVTMLMKCIAGWDIW